MRLPALANGWTGGQYSLLRALFGVWLMVHFLHLLPWSAELFSDAGVLADASASPYAHLFPNVFAWIDSPVFVQALHALAVGAAVLFAIGRFDRSAAIFLWYLLACQFGRNPLILNPALPYLGLLLIVHALLPPAPYGSWTARGRVDPGGGWRFDPRAFALLWILAAVGYLYSAWTKFASPSWLDGTAFTHLLENPLARDTALRSALLALPDGMLRLATWSALALELLYAPLACFRRARPWVWLVAVLMHLSLIVLVDFADLSLGMLFLHAITFDPAWLKPRRDVAPLRVYYDGSCGLCHGAVRFLLAEDAAGTAFRFAPLQGETFAEEVSDQERAWLPDSLVIQSPAGSLATRSDGVLRAMDALGGVWRLLALVGRAVPRRLRDFAYDRVAGVRLRLFAQPKELCPLLPAALRERFEA